MTTACFETCYPTELKPGDVYKRHVYRPRLVLSTARHGSHGVEYVSITYIRYDGVILTWEYYVGGFTRVLRMVCE